MTPSNNRIIIKIFFIALATLVLLLSYQSVRQKKDIKYLKLIANSKDEIDRSVYNEIMTTYYMNECLQLDTNLQLFSYNSQNYLSFRDVFKNGKYLVLRISKQDCSSCIDSVFSIVRDAFHAIETKKVILLSDEPNPRIALVNQRLQGIRYPIYKLNKETLPISFDSETPYFFIVNEFGEVCLLHNVDVKSLQLAKKYLKIVVNRFFQDGQ